MTRARVFLHNETDEALALVSRDVVDGDWTTPPPDRIEPRSVVVFGSEADGLYPDTEGRATYQIGDAADHTVYVHWNDPFLGSNAFHTNTDDSHYAFWTASSGRHCEAHFTVRPAGTVMTDFLPSRDAFRFGNSFGDAPYTLPPLRGTLLDQKYGNAKNGLCGGMVFAALDYFTAQWRIPQDTTAPMGEQSPLFLFLVDRLFATFSVDSVSLMLALINPAYPDGDENPLSALGMAHGRAAVMAYEEWPIIRADIDAGRPSPMFLTTVKSLNPGDLGLCHQVLAYGYDVHGHSVTIHVYDPNSPEESERDGVQLSFDDGDVSQRIVVTHNVDVTDSDDGHQLPVYCFGRMDYSYVEPPAYTEPRLSGYEVDRRGSRVMVGEPLLVSSTVTGSGTRTYDVWPDCGEHDFAYTDYADVSSVSVTATPHGYYDPRLVWRVDGAVVAEGTDTDLELRGIPEFAENSVPVTVHVRLADAVLTVTNRAEDGNYSIPVDIRSTERGEQTDPGRTWSTLLSFTGAREEVPGLAEAMGQCMHNYINAHRAGEPDLAAELAAFYAQLRRPPDPLWDPDPAMAEAGALAAGMQPDLASLEEVSRIPEVSAPVAVHAGPEGIDTAGIDTVGIDTAGIDTAGIDTVGIDTAGIDTAGVAVLTPEQLAAKLEKDLQKDLRDKIGGVGGFQH